MDEILHAQDDWIGISQVFSTMFVTNTLVLIGNRQVSRLFRLRHNSEGEKILVLVQKEALYQTFKIWSSRARLVNSRYKEYGSYMKMVELKHGKQLKIFQNLSRDKSDIFFCKELNCFIFYDPVNFRLEKIELTSGGESEIIRNLSSMHKKHGVFFGTINRKEKGIQAVFCIVGEKGHSKILLQDLDSENSEEIDFDTHGYTSNICDVLIPKWREDEYQDSILVVNKFGLVLGLNLETGAIIKFFGRKLVVKQVRMVSHAPEMIIGFESPFMIAQVWNVPSMEPRLCFNHICPREIESYSRDETYLHSDGDSAIYSLFKPKGSMSGFKIWRMSYLQENKREILSRKKSMPYKDMTIFYKGFKGRGLYFLSSFYSITVFRKSEILLEVKENLNVYLPKYGIGFFKNYLNRAVALPVEIEEYGQLNHMLTGSIKQKKEKKIVSKEKLPSPYIRKRNLTDGDIDSNTEPELSQTIQESEEEISEEEISNDENNLNKKIWVFDSESRIFYFTDGSVFLMQEMKMIENIEELAMTSLGEKLIPLKEESKKLVKIENSRIILYECVDFNILKIVENVKIDPIRAHVFPVLFSDQLFVFDQSASKIDFKTGERLSLDTRTAFLDIRDQIRTGARYTSAPLFIEKIMCYPQLSNIVHNDLLAHELVLERKEPELLLRYLQNFGFYDNFKFSYKEIFLGTKIDKNMEKALKVWWRANRAGKKLGLDWKKVKEGEGCNLI